MKPYPQACNPGNESHQLLPIIAISRSASFPFPQQTLKFSTASITDASTTVEEGKLERLTQAQHGHRNFWLLLYSRSLISCTCKLVMGTSGTRDLFIYRVYSNYRSPPVSQLVSHRLSVIINLSLSGHRAYYYLYCYWAIVARLIVLLWQAIIPAPRRHCSFSTTSTRQLLNHTYISMEEESRLSPIFK